MYVYIFCNFQLREVEVLFQVLLQFANQVIPLIKNIQEILTITRGLYFVLKKSKYASKSLEMDKTYIKKKT